MKAKIDKDISINDLIVLAIHLLDKENKETDFENILKKCFQLSPQLISFERNNWPDARKLDRPLRSLRKQKLVTGDPKSLFSLTKKGEKGALEINKKLYQAKLL